MAVNGVNTPLYSQLRYTIKKASLTVFLKGTVPVDVEHISLFPVNTWHGHENGLRKDLAQHLANLKPGVMRFPAVV